MTPAQPALCDSEREPQLPAPFRATRLDVPAALLAAAHTHIASSSSRRVAKPGGRTELALPLDTPGLSELVRALGRPRGELVFASLLVAPAGCGAAHQAFHRDGDSTDESAWRALVYLSDVAGPDDGAIEFAGAAPVVGPPGTAVSYAASSLHRGRANATGRADRLALGLAFSSAGTAVCTVGGGGCGGGCGGGGDGGGCGGGGTSSSDSSSGDRSSGDSSRPLTPQESANNLRSFVSFVALIAFALTVASIPTCWAWSFNEAHPSNNVCFGLLDSSSFAAAQNLQVSQTAHAAAAASCLVMAAIGAGVLMLGPFIYDAFVKGADAALRAMRLPEYHTSRLLAAAVMLVFVLIGLALGVTFAQSVPVAPLASWKLGPGANCAIAASVFATLASLLFRLERFADAKAEEGSPQVEASAQVLQAEQDRLRVASQAADAVAFRAARQARPSWTDFDPALLRLFSCGLCHRVLLVPVTASCGQHNFCMPCLKQWRQNISTCPTCRAPGPISIGTDTPLHENVGIASAIATYINKAEAQRTVESRDATLADRKAAPSSG